MPARDGSPFVGRAAERAALERHHAAACDGAGRFVLVTGEAGIGKTRLVEEAIGPPGTPGVAWGRCREDRGAPAFWPWIEVLRPLLATASPECLRAALAGGAAELARLLPELRPHAAGDQAAPAPPPGSPAARFRLFDAVTSLLAALAAEPLAVVLDDLHWADSETLLLLRFLAPEVRRRRLLLVATCREDELAGVPDAPGIRADLT
ncbi:MAG: ATP-binding protein, partial [Thermodesulfobacteriota bacterium]